jgi:zinc/manganese transport system substrate-binding protein
MSASRLVIASFCALTLLAGFGGIARAEAPSPVDRVNIVVTIPVLKDLAEQVGGARVNVTSLLSGQENEHTYAPKPSDILAVRKARLLVEVGLGLEVWVASLVNNSGNPSLRVVTTSKGIALIRDRQGDGGRQSPAREARGGGNPHIWLDPENAKVMMRHITEALMKEDPDFASTYRENQAAYLGLIDRVQAELMERTRSLPDRRLIAHHPAWPYFARRFGFKIVDEIVAQAGAEPSAHHLRRLVDRIRRDRIRVIVSEPQLNQKIPEALARETGARLVVLSPLPGAMPGTETYLDLLRYNVRQLVNALS